ncbi:MAG: hypothetical protein PHD96_01065 [Candidatus Pacebacteria bacterium]|jgi:hypothetical protein|nr:hypothetical protein [Candidatus Paceibacterota bacterium]
MNGSEINILKESKAIPTWPKGLFTFSLVIFLITVGIWAGLNFYWLEHQTRRLDEINAQFEKLRASFPLEKEQEVALLEKKTSILKKLLADRIYFSKALVFLENFTHPEIYYTNLIFSSTNNILDLEGVAQNEGVLSQAVNSFAARPNEVSAVIIRNARIIEGGKLAFNLRLIFSSQTLNYQNERNY